MKTLPEVIKDFERWMDSPDMELTPETIYAIWYYLKSYQNLLKLTPFLVNEVEKNVKKGKTIG